MLQQRRVPDDSGGPRDRARRPLAAVVFQRSAAEPCALDSPARAIARAVRRPRDGRALATLARRLLCLSDKKNGDSL
jgi:hypothetical protein